MSENFQNNSGEEELSYLPPQIANKFNWGACILGLYWLKNNTDYEKHKKYIKKKYDKCPRILMITMVILPITLFVSIYKEIPIYTMILISSLILITLLISLSVAMFKHGQYANIIAWQTKKWESLNQFLEVQEKWSRKGKIYGIIYSSMIILSVLYAVLLIYHLK